MAAILVVQGVAVFAHDLARLLRRMGHTVDIAYSGDDALRAAEAGLEERGASRSTGTSLGSPTTRYKLKVRGVGGREAQD